MPLIVKPNTRRMRYMRDSPSETTAILVAGIAGAAVVGLIVLASH
jgi:hypothetical protein